jgi:hypothetical protein
MVRCEWIRRRKKKGGGDKFSDYGIFLPPPFFFLPFRPAARTIPPRTQRASGISYGKSRKSANSCNGRGWLHEKIKDKGC